MSEATQQNMPAVPRVVDGPPPPPPQEIKSARELDSERKQARRLQEEQQHLQIRTDVEQRIKTGEDKEGAVLRGLIVDRIQDESRYQPNPTNNYEHVAYAYHRANEAARQLQLNPRDGEEANRLYVALDAMYQQVGRKYAPEIQVSGNVSKSERRGLILNAMQEDLRQFPEMAADHFMGDYVDIKAQQVLIKIEIRDEIRKDPGNIRRGDLYQNAVKLELSNRRLNDFGEHVAVVAGGWDGINAWQDAKARSFAPQSVDLYRPPSETNTEDELHAKYKQRKEDYRKEVLGAPAHSADKETQAFNDLDTDVMARLVDMEDEIAYAQQQINANLDADRTNASEIVDIVDNLKERDAERALAFAHIQTEVASQRLENAVKTLSVRSIPEVVRANIYAARQALAEQAMRLRQRGLLGSRRLDFHPLQDVALEVNEIRTDAKRAIQERLEQRRMRRIKDKLDKRTRNMHERFLAVKRGYHNKVMREIGMVQLAILQDPDTQELADRWDSLRDTFVGSNVSADDNIDLRWGTFGESQEATYENTDLGKAERNLNIQESHSDAYRERRKQLGAQEQADYDRLNEVLLKDLDRKINVIREVSQPIPAPTPEPQPASSQASSQSRRSAEASDQSKRRPAETSIHTFTHEDVRRGVAEQQVDQQKQYVQNDIRSNENYRRELRRLLKPKEGESTGAHSQEAKDLLKRLDREQRELIGKARKYGVTDEQLADLNVPKWLLEERSQNKGRAGNKERRRSNRGEQRATGENRKDKGNRQDNASPQEGGKKLDEMTIDERREELEKRIRMIDKNLAYLEQRHKDSTNYQKNKDYLEEQRAKALGRLTNLNEQNP